jgi:4-oxalocrotonate tautomerase
MPQVIVRLSADKTDGQKTRLAGEIAQALIATIGSTEASVSVSFEDVAPADGPETVYNPEILDKPNQLFRKPG